MSASRPSVDFPEPPVSGELAIDLPAGARCAVCLSHDIDHLSLREHIVDGFLPRYAYGLVRQNLVGRFRPLRALDGLAGIPLAALGRDRWVVLDALRAAEERVGVRSTWFIAVRRGVGISYTDAQIQQAVQELVGAGLEVGLHGQSPQDAAGIAAEVADLERFAGQKIRGLRMHYLRLSSAVFDGMQEAGLSYDSTVMDRTLHPPEDHPLAGPRLVREGLVEIPLHVMDSTLFSVTGFGLDLQGAENYVFRLIDRAASLGKAVTVNLHPNNYSRQAPDIRRWYDSLLEHVALRDDVFVTDFRGLVERIQIP